MTVSIRNIARRIPLIILVAVFVIAGIAKVRSPHLFALDIINFRLIPSFLIPLFPFVLASYLPYLELTTAAGLLIRRWRLGALLLAGAMLSVFTVAFILAWIRGIELQCGCFGHGTGSASIRAKGLWNFLNSNPGHLLQNIFLLMAWAWAWKEELRFS